MAEKIIKQIGMMIEGMTYCNCYIYDSEENADELEILLEHSLMDWYANIPKDEISSKTDIESLVTKILDEFKQDIYNEFFKI